MSVSSTDSSLYTTRWQIIKSVINSQPLQRYPFASHASEHIDRTLRHCLKLKTSYTRDFPPPKRPFRYRKRFSVTQPEIDSLSDSLPTNIDQCLPVASLKPRHQTPHHFARCNFYKPQKKDKWTTKFKLCKM